MALRPGISLVSEGYVVMTIELNTSKAWDYKISHKLCVVSITLPG